MVLIGASWILFWALVQLLDLTITKAAGITGIVFVIAGLVLGERAPFTHKT